MPIPKKVQRCYSVSQADVKRPAPKSTERSGSFVNAPVKVPAVQPLVKDIYQSLMQVHHHPVQNAQYLDAMVDYHIKQNPHFSIAEFNDLCFGDPAEMNRRRIEVIMDSNPTEANVYFIALAFHRQQVRSNYLKYGQQDLKNDWRTDYHRNRTEFSEPSTTPEFKRLLKESQIQPELHQMVEDLIKVHQHLYPLASDAISTKKP